MSVEKQRFVFFQTRAAFSNVHVSIIREITSHGAENNQLWRRGERRFNCRPIRNYSQYQQAYHGQLARHSVLSYAQLLLHNPYARRL